MGGVDAIDTLPWSTDLGFAAAMFTASHKTLILRHGWTSGESAFELVFTGVAWMELGTHYSGLTITPLREYGRFGESWCQPLLLLDLRDQRGRRGFVACSLVGVEQFEVGGSPRDRERLSWVSASYSDYGVGGQPVEPGDPHHPGALRKFRLPTAEERAAVVP